MGFKLPTIWTAIGAGLGAIPGIIKGFKDRARIKQVEKINDSIDGNDDKSVTKQLSDIVAKEDRRNKANS